MTRTALSAAAILLAGAIAGNLAPSMAGNDLSASPWRVSEHARIRLVPGATTADGARKIGVQIEMEEGWHTYWRHPGASGVPPRFDWSGSYNLARAEVAFPAPKRLRDEYGVSFGYRDEVVFPVTIEPKEAGAPLAVRLAVDFAVCREICIPDFAELALDLPAGVEPREVFSKIVARFAEKVPEAQGEAAGIGVNGVKAEMRAGEPVLLVGTDQHAAAANAELFVEGPEKYYFVIPDAPDGDGRYVVEIRGASAAEELRGVRVRTTLVSVGNAVEAWWTVE